MEKNWKHINNPERVIVNELSEFIDMYENSGKIFLPNLRQSNSLILFSDYSGDQKDSNLLAYSVLIIDEESFQSFIAYHNNFWKAHSLENRTIDYKGLGDKIKAWALIPFLQFCNNINGLLLTLVIPKKVKSIFLEEKPEDLKEQLLVWKSSKTQEKFLRLLHVIMLVLNGLGKSFQDILWITDNDDIVANELQLATANKILKEKLSRHLDYEMGSFELKSHIIDSREKILDKLSSVPDLVAGALVDFVGDYKNANINVIQGEIAQPISHSKTKVNPITKWLSENEKLNNLKKITIYIEESDYNNLSATLFRFPNFINFQDNRDSKI